MLTADGKRAYVGNAGGDFGGGGSVSIIDTATNTVTGTILSGFGVREMAVSSDGYRVDVSGGSGLSPSVIAISTKPNFA